MKAIALSTLANKYNRNYRYLGPVLAKAGLKPILEAQSGTRKVKYYDEAAAIKVLETHIAAKSEKKDVATPATESLQYLEKEIEKLQVAVAYEHTAAQNRSIAIVKQLEKLQANQAKIQEMVTQIFNHLTEPSNGAK